MPDLLMDELTIMNHYLNTLNESLFAFKELLNTSYKIKVARKDKAYDINLVFLKRNFTHLFGIEKLLDFRLFDTIPDFYNRLIAGNEFSDYIKEKMVKSKYFKSIINRLYSIIDLRENFYNAKNNKHYKFVCKEYGNYTSIDYDFIIKSVYDRDTYYYFLRRDTNAKDEKQYVLVSLFIENEKDYTRCQSYMTLLEKVEIDRMSHKETIIYKRNSWPIVWPIKPSTGLAWDSLIGLKRSKPVEIGGFKWIEIDQIKLNALNSMRLTLLMKLKIGAIQ